MREFSLRVREAFQNGLRPKEELSLNVPYLEKCLGFSPGFGGLTKRGVSLPTLEQGVWPFPQLVRGHEFDFLLYEREINAYDLDRKRKFVQYQGSGDGDVWHFADNYYDYLFTNGQKIVYFDEAIVSIEHQINTATYIRGRFWLGGFNLRDFSEKILEA